MESGDSFCTVRKSSKFKHTDGNEMARRDEKEKLERLKELERKQQTFFYVKGTTR
jgi:hypothetical protein